MSKAIVFLLLMYSVGSQAQGTITPEQMDSIEKSELVFRFVEQAPKYPGGEKELTKYLGNIKHPPTATKQGFSGTTYIEFVIDVDGKVINPKIARSSGREVLDNAALEHVRNMPLWEPALQNGKAVQSIYTVPVKFF